MIRVSKDALLRALEAVQPGLSPREIVEQSASFIFRKGQVHTFNDEIACRCPSGLDTSFEGAVPAQKLIEIVRKLPEDQITLELENGQLVIIGKRRRVGLRYDPNITLPINVERPKEWIKLPTEFADAIQVVHQCASRDESQFNLTCVRVHPKWIEATDRFQICRWRMATGFAEPMLVRQSSVKHVTSLGMTEFAQTESWLHFRNPERLVLSCRRYVEDYPDLGEHLKVEGEPATLPKGLADAADKAAVFSSENDVNNVVKVELRPGKVRLRGEGPSGWYSETKKLPRYAGKPIAFLIAPQILIEIVRKHSECVISESKLGVNGGAYRYCTCLSSPDEKKSEEGTQEETDE